MTTATLPSIERRSSTEVLNPSSPCRRAAAAVELQSGHFDAERGDAAEHGCLAARIALAEHDVIDPGRVEPGSFNDCGRNEGDQLLRGKLFEHASVSSDGCP